jgi:PPOX class probable F420-dependent enzyme
MWRNGSHSEASRGGDPPLAAKGQHSMVSSQETVELAQEVRELLDLPALYNLATVNPNGTIQLNPIWGELHEGKVRINTLAGRQKHKNLADRGDRVTVMVTDPANPLRYVEIRGRVDEITDANGVEVIDRLAKKYTGADTYPHLQEGDVRVTITISPLKVFTHW